MKCAHCQLPAMAHPLRHCKYRYRVVLHPITNEPIGYMLFLKDEG